MPTWATSHVSTHTSSSTPVLDVALGTCAPRRPLTCAPPAHSRRRIVQRLLDVFPLQTLEPSASARGGVVDKHPTVVFIATLPLPDPNDDLEALLPTSPVSELAGWACHASKRF